MNAEIVIYLLALASGVFLTLSLQAHRKAQKAVKEAQEAVASVDRLSEQVKAQEVAFARQIETNIESQRSEADKRIQKLEIRLEDLTNRVASLQIRK
jgi:CHASE3 domain sensor protein